MDPKVDNRNKLKGLLKEASFQVNPNKASHSELVKQTDSLESIDSKLSQPITIKNNHPITVKVVQEPTEQPVEVKVTNQVPPFPEKIQMEWSGSPSERAAQFFSLLQGMPGKDSVVPGPAGKDGKNGVDGKNGRDGRDGETIVGPMGPAGKDGVDGKDAETPKVLDLVKAVIAEIKKSKALDISNIRNTESIISATGKVNSGSFMFNGTRYAISELMHGGGGSGGGSFTILTATGAVDRSNTVFGFSVEPSLIISDGISLTRLDNNLVAQWTWDAGAMQATLNVPPLNSVIGIQ